MLLSCTVGAPISSTNNSNKAQPRSNYSGICVLGTLSTECFLAQSCLALWNPSDWSHPVSSVHGILPARILEWVASSFSRRYSWFRDLTHNSCIANRLFSITESPPPTPHCTGIFLCSYFCEYFELLSGTNLILWHLVWLHQRRLREGNGTPLQYSCLENPMDGGAWKTAVHGIAEGRTWLSDFTFTFHFHALEKEMATHSNVLAWRIPGTGEPGGLSSMGSHRVGHDWSDSAAAASKKATCL